MGADYEKYKLTVLQKKNHVRFLKLIELENLDARSLCNVVVTHYQKTGIPLERLVMVTSDGASVMRGHSNGLVERLKV